MTKSTPGRTDPESSLDDTGSQALSEAHSRRDPTLDVLASIDASLRRIAAKGLPVPAAPVGKGITLTCGSKLTLYAQATETNTEWDWGCNDPGYEAAARNLAEGDAKSTVNEDLQRQIALITCEEPCEKRVGDISHTTVFKRTKDKCVPPTCTIKCWYQGEAKVEGRVEIECVRP